MLRTFRRPLVLLVLVLLAGAGSAQALPAVEDSRDEARFQNPLVLAWDWMASLFEKAGVFIDPNGSDGPQSEPGGEMNLDAGVFIDPNGGQ